MTTANYSRIGHDTSRAISQNLTRADANRIKNRHNRDYGDSSRAHVMRQRDGAWYVWIDCDEDRSTYSPAHRHVKVRDQRPPPPKHKRTDRQKRIAFFHEWSGCITGQKMLGAMHAADAEIEAEWIGLKVVWEEECDISPEDSFSDPRDVAMVRSGAWTWEYAYVKFPSGERGVSLGGISFATGPGEREQRRAMEAELLLETLGPVRYVDLYKDANGSD